MNGTEFWVRATAPKKNYQKFSSFHEFASQIPVEQHKNAPEKEHKCLQAFNELLERKNVGVRHALCCGCEKHGHLCCSASVISCALGAFSLHTSHW